MYKTCMFCTRPLKTNEVVEEFPIGRRLAFDAAKGRLWVVCRHCQRWNLTPLEERWEAVETCEKLFRETRLRTSSENIGLARHPEGLELVRIGEPLRPEFAAWRYGDQFGKRRRRQVLTWTAMGAVVGLNPWIIPSLGVGGLAGVIMAAAAPTAINMWNLTKQIARFAHSDGEVRALARAQVRNSTRIRPADDEIGFRVETHMGMLVEPGKGRLLTSQREWFEGEDARRAVNAILSLINFGGGGRVDVKQAVSQIEAHKHPQQFLNDVVERPMRWNSKGVPGWIHKMPKPTRLALEMAVHEEDERRALEGELWRLEQAWRDAEEIAAISDSLLLPKGTARFLSRHSSHDEGS